MGELTRALNEDTGRSLADCPVKPQLLADLLLLIDKGTISNKIAKTVFDEMYKSGKSPSVIVEEQGLVQVSDTGAIEAIIDEVMAREAGQVAEYRSGKEKVFGFFVGQVMRASKGKANPAVVNELLLAKLKA
jgi:aspartyl-tRNA(Asn)/glutamyl-tRNA(Gln) amidotransferase subunit B